MSAAFRFFRRLRHMRSVRLAWWLMQYDAEEKRGRGV
jgi:hypothetical protein